MTLRTPPPPVLASARVVAYAYVDHVPHKKWGALYAGDTLVNCITSKRSRGCWRSRAAHSFPPYKSSSETTGIYTSASRSSRAAGVKVARRAGCTVPRLVICREPRTLEPAARSPRQDPLNGQAEWRAA
jgi:hypothetical protein